MATLVQDTFTRANSTNVLGVATSGQTWRVDQGTFGIINNTAYTSVNTYNSFAVIDCGVGDPKVQIDLPTYPAGSTIEVALYINYKDSLNHYVLSCNAYTLSLDKKVNDTITNLNIAFAGYALQGKTLAVERVGNVLNVYFNGVLQFSATDTTWATQTLVGFGNVEGGTTPRFDNFLVTGTVPTTTNLKRWTGSAFSGTPQANIKRYTGSAFGATTSVKRWNGTSWATV